MKFSLFTVLLTLSLNVYGQQELQLTDLRDFKVGKNWKIGGSATADIWNKEKMSLTRGEGVLVNIPSEKHQSNLLTREEYGDLDLELEFMMAAHSNSGIYMQGRYEIQLLDSWGKQNPTYGDCGGIYQRRRKDGSQFEGHAPLINASKAPGTWQKMKISFQAPRFDSDGRKVRNARILEVRLNGYTVQENIELTGPTGGPISEEESATGPLMIQGDHGPVAFRKIKLSPFHDKNVVVKDTKYQLYKGDIKPLQAFDFEGMTVSEAKVNEIDATRFSEELGWAVVYSGMLEIPENDEYRFYLQAGGESMMRVGSNTVVEKGWSRPNWPARTSEPVQLNAGLHPFEVYYAKVDGWLRSGLGIYIESDKMRRQALHSGIDPNLISTGQAPVYLNAEKARINRSFISYPDGDGSVVLTHVVNVGSPEGLHFAFNSENGALLKLWRGNFLDVSQMWMGRGNGQSAPRGAELLLSNSNWLLSINGSDGIDFRSKGYDVDREGHPIFRYSINGNLMKDLIEASDGKLIKRTITSEESVELSIRIVSGNTIAKVSDTLYSINDSDFFVKSDAPLSVEKVGNQYHLILTGNGREFTYSIIW